MTKKANQKTLPVLNAFNNGQITSCFIRLSPFSPKKKNETTIQEDTSKESSSDRAAPGSGIIEKEMKPQRKMTVLTL
jgi:hypothetical protein